MDILTFIDEMERNSTPSGKFEREIMKGIFQNLRDEQEELKRKADAIDEIDFKYGNRIMDDEIDVIVTGEINRILKTVITDE